MFTEYTGNRQFNLQLNRTFVPILDRPGIDKIAATTLPRLRTTTQITTLAQHLAERFEKQGDADAAWRLYELAAFYLGADDPRKHRFIDAMSRTFDEAHRGLALTRHSVPYRGGELTAMRWEADPADQAQAPSGTPTTLVMMNGFDGYAEEIIDFASHFPARPFDIITFDGPGQGHTAAAGMPLEPEWEHPTEAVLDYFGVTSAAALGVSFGGYLVTRAAAHCPRITQPCLVLAGDADQYVPFERLGDVRCALRNAKSLEVRAFHDAQDPDMAQHCQIGDLDRAFAIMGDWLSGPQPRSGA